MNFEALIAPLAAEVLAHGTPGVAVALVTGGELAVARGYGVQSVDTARPLTADSVLHLASLGKTFTATAVMQLVERGKIELARPVASYLPHFHLADPRFADITVEEMLSHRS